MTDVGARSWNFWQWSGRPACKGWFSSPLHGPRIFLWVFRLSIQMSGNRRKSPFTGLKPPGLGQAKQLVTLLSVKVDLLRRLEFRTLIGLLTSHKTSPYQLHKMLHPTNVCSVRNKWRLQSTSCVIVKLAHENSGKILAELF